MTCSNVFTSLAEWTKRRSAGTDLFTYYGWFFTTFNFIQYDLGHPVIEQPFSLRWSRIYGPCYVRGGDFKAKISSLWIFCINHPPLKECLQPWSGRASMTSIISWAEGRLRAIFERFSFCLLLSSSLHHYWYSKMFSFFLVDQNCLPAQQATLLWGVSPWGVLGLSNETKKKISNETKKDIKWARGQQQDIKWNMKTAPIFKISNQSGRLTCRQRCTKSLGPSRKEQPTKYWQ